MLKIKHLTASRYRVLPWKNHRGTTSEIYIHPEGASFHTDPFLWRVSSASIASCSSFSQFPGYDRTILLIEGDRMELNHDCLETPQIVGFMEPHEFKGEWVTTCEIGDQAVRDFNLMTRRGKVKSRMDVLSGDELLKPFLMSERHLLIFCVQGSAEVSSEGAKYPLRSFETLILEEDSAAPAKSIGFRSLAEGTRLIAVQVSTL